MRKFTLNNKRINNVKRGEVFYFDSDLNESIKSCAPGEWIEVEFEAEKRLGFVNPFVENGHQVTILDSYFSSPESYLLHKIDVAINKRILFGYNQCRLIYGFEDGMPGVVVDCYENACILQISNAGMDKYRELIKKEIETRISTKVYFLDNVEYRKKESLPQYEIESIPEEIKIQENGFNYVLKKDVFQKVGYYFDHRENRQKLENLLARFNKKFTSGVDLFCYIGSWGLHLLRSGVEKVEFVDQANMETSIYTNLILNKLENRGHFHRADVFKYLDQQINDKKKFDVIVCDPPSFTKSVKNKDSALSGYEKLYNKIGKIMNPGGIVVAASCTQYITLEELDIAVGKGFGASKIKRQVLDLGLAGWDHPCDGIKSKSNYIKYICYYVE